MFHVVKSNAHRTRRRNRRTSDCFFLYSSPIYLYAPISPNKKRLHTQSWCQQAFDAPYSLILEEAEPSDWQHSVITVMGGCLKLYSTRLMPMHWVSPTENIRPFMIRSKGFCNVFLHQSRYSMVCARGSKLWHWHEIIFALRVLYLAFSSSPI